MITPTLQTLSAVYTPNLIHLVSSSMISLDEKILLYFNHCENVFLDDIMINLSATWTWSLMMLTVFFVVLKDRPIREGALILLGILLCVLMADQISSSIIKPWVERLRPAHNPDLMFQVRYITGRGGLYGFVSSHSANTFAVATFLSLVFRHGLTSVCLFVWASAVGFSRIYLAKHFPSDVFVGMILGIGVGALLYYILYFIITRMMNVTTQYHSNAYTPSGFLLDDIHLILASMSLTLFYVMF